MKNLSIISIYMLFSICMSCATYKALPEASNLITGNDENYSTECIQGTEGTKIYCATDDNLMSVSINPYQAVPCQKLDFYAYCGINNDGSVFWDFKDGTTATIKEGQKTYERAGYFNIEVTCTYTDGTQITGVLPVAITNTYGYGVTEIKPGDTSCPRVETKK